jgi:hypothetical protein
MTCANLHAHERFAKQRAGWDKEYRRIYARKLRGTVSQAEWDAWRSAPAGSANAPEMWVSFDRWKAGDYDELLSNLPPITPQKGGNE